MKQYTIETPDGYKAVETKVDNGILIRFVEEEKYEPKDGDICALDFKCFGGVKKLIFCLKSIRGRGCDSINYYFGINGGGDFGTGGYYGYQDKDIIRPATTEEQKQLFDALKEKGKKWNAEKKCIEDIEQYILVPEEINITRSGNKPCIVNGNQVLYYSNGGNWAVYVRGDAERFRNKVKCKLVKCKWDDLKVGDVFYCCDCNLEGIDKLTRCKIKLDDKSCVYWWDNSAAVRDFEWNFYYKVVPINN